MQTHVAVKLIDPELAKKETARERFRREATAAAQLRSAHVVQILDHGIDGDQPFIVMELLDGEDLFERLAHRGRLSLRETSKIVTQVARALSRAHAAGIVHRDLKPENVFLCPNEDDEVVKVLDFGVAKVKDAARVTMQKTNVGTLIGTPHYMSPEQVKGIGDIDFRTDLWALGVIAFQCVTGEMPFDSEGVGDLLIKISMGEIPVPSKVYPGVPVPFDPWFAKACERDPAKRFQSAREVAVSLAAVVTQVDGTAPRAPTVRPPAASGSGLSKSLPAPPRMPGISVHEIDASVEEFEEVDPFDEDDDDRPTRMRQAPEPTPAPKAALKIPEPKVSRPGAAAIPAPRPSVPNAPRPAAGAPASVPKIPAPRIPSHDGIPSSRPSSPMAPPIAAPPAHEGHEIVDFDETIPATDMRVSDIGVLVRAGAGAPPLSEPPRAPSPPPPAPSRSPLDLAPEAVLAPVVLAPPRVIAPAPASTPTPSRPAPTPPRPAPAPAFAPPSTPAIHATTAPVEVESLRAAYTEPPPELDGTSKRRRMVRFMVAGLVIFAAGIAWTVVRSQIDLGGGVSGTPSVTAPSATTPPPPPSASSEPSSAPTTTATAIDPGKVSRPTKPTPAVKGPPRPRPRKASPQPNDGTIVVPDPPPDEDSVPAAP
ncbi:Adenylate cyclase [Minicystis rosea]|nr:Adenylate cyclase [Minicystis rosea]